MFPLVYRLSFLCGLMPFMVFTNCFAQVDDSLRIVVVDTVKLSQLDRLNPGDKFPPVYFYNLKGEKCGSDSLFKAKPVIFITGSYSCPIFRYNTKRMYKDIRRKSKNYDIYFVYLLEAHPLAGSPYGRLRDSSRQNKKDSIFITQQKYMQERIAWAAKARNDFNINARVLVDNENNDFFLKFNASPNSYLEFSSEQLLLKRRTWYYKNGYMKPVKRKVKKPAMELKK
ncbi:MAG TPA: hypothetical protein VD905_18985 [Flavobacteriales bacterium]|nr:hypothetical protein [Flavobacteriales bacterium]